MSDYLKRREREKKLEKIRGKAKAKPTPAPKSKSKYRGDLGGEGFEPYRGEARRSLALREAAGEGFTREQLRAQGYRAIAKYNDLAEHGYQIVHWFSPALHQAGETAELYEYAPSTHRQKLNVGVELPRLTATTTEEQQAIHAALGVRDDEVCETQLDLFGASPRKKRRKRKA